MNPHKRAVAPLLALVVTMVAAFIISMLLVIVTLDPPLADLQQLFLFMVGTGGGTIALVYLLHRRRLIQWFTSLRWTLLTIIILTVALVFINVYITAQLMFISEHDLILTSALLIYGGVIAVMSVIVIAGTLIERIHQLGDAARRLARGDLRTRLHVQGNDELAQLAQVFNQMAVELEALDTQKRQLEQSRRDLIAGASHDLRSPLAAVRAMNEAIIDGVVRDEQTVLRYRQQMQREIEHLGRLIDDLFELAQMDVGHLPLARKPTDLNALIADTLDGLEARAAGANITIGWQMARELPPLALDDSKIARVLYNLLDNALHHTPSGGSVEVAAERAQGGVRVRVHNSGSYIAPDDLTHIFDRFYRGENARSARRDGQRSTGLGLAIAKGFIEAHGGHISAESHLDRGTTFSIWLPL